MKIADLCTICDKLSLIPLTQEYVMTEFLRMNGMYWGLTSMALAGQLDRMDRQEVLDFVSRCQHECGGVSCSIGHDPHLLATLSAVQVRSLLI